MELFEEFCVVQPVQPINPVLLTANAVSSSEIDLSVAWTGGSLTAIYVYYALNAGGPWTLLTTFPSATGSYRHLGLTASTPYFYQAYAVTSGPVYGPATYATASTQAASGTLTITSLTPPTTNVGSFLNYALTATGGSGSYLWNIESAAPNYGKWLALPVAALQGVPQNAETSSVVIRCTDANNTSNTTTATILVTSVASGALAASTFLPSQSGVVGGAYANQMLLSGGKPPYSFTSSVAQPYTQTVDGWLLGAPTATGSVTPTVVATDSSNATLNLSPSFTVNNTQLALQGYDPVLQVVNLPLANAGSPYSHTLAAYNASGSVAWAISSGSLPSGLTLSNGVISGTPTNPGNRSFTLKATDSAAKTISAQGYLNVAATTQANRPGYNTGAGFFALNGKLYDPDGFQFTIRGVNRNHYDSASWASGANGALSGANTCRFFMYLTDGSVPVASYAAVANTQCIANDILPIITMAYFPDGTTTSGNTSTTELSAGVTWWVNNVSAFAPYMNDIAINVANEWGASPSFGGSYTTWVSAYSSAISSLRSAGYTCPIVIDALDEGEDIGGFTGGYAAQILAADPQKNVIFDFHFYNTTNVVCPISAITQAGNAMVTFNNTSATNPFISLPNFSQQVYIAGVSGMTQINGGPYSVTGHSGASGAWSLTLSVNSSSFGAYTGGGQIIDAWYFDERIANVQSFIQAGLCCFVGEFGPAGLNNSTCSPSQIISACESRAVGWAQWAWDDNNLGGGATSFTGWFGMTLAGPGTYTAPSSLTAPGLQAITNPRLGLDALGAPASAFLASSNTISWNPGFYLLSFNQSLNPGNVTYAGSAYATDMSNAFASGSNIKGYALFANWAFFEGGSSGIQGTFPNILNNGTSFFAGLMSDAQAKNERVIVQFNPGDFIHGAYAPTSGTYIPSYILTTSGFGAANVGSSGITPSSPYLYGYYETANGGPMANWVGNSNVYNAMLAAIQQFANIWDGNPYLEAFVMCADDVMYPNAGTGLAGNGYFTTLTSLMLAIKGYFKHTNVALQMAGAQSTAGQSYVQTLVQAGVLVSRSDTEGAPSWTNTAEAVVFSSISGTTGVLTFNLPWPGNTFNVKFNTGQVVSMTTDIGGSKNVTFSPAVTGSPTSATKNRAWPDMGPAMQAWANLQSPASTWPPPSQTLQSYSTSIMFGEEGDWTDATGTSPVGPGYTGAQMAAACNDSVTGGIGWHASHMLISYSNSTTWANRTTNATNGAFNVPLTNTAYPSVYNASTPTPKLTSLAPLTLQIPNWNDFIGKTGGKTWTTNTAYASPYGSTLRRLTNRSTLTNGSSCGLEYSEGAAKISRQINGNQYWVGFVDANNAYYVGKYQLGTGMVSYFTPTWSASVEGNLGVCFSMLPGEANIVYIASKGAHTIQRYDCSAQAWAPNTIFSGANATYTFPGGNGPGGWMQTSWAGDRLVWMATWAGLPQTVYCLMLSGASAGTLYQYSGSPTGQMQVSGAAVTSATTTSVTVSGANWSPGPDGNGLWANQGVSITFTSGVNNGTSKTITHNTATTITWSGVLGTAPSPGDTFNVYGINELHMFRGTTNAVVIEANTGLGQLPMIWFPASGVTTQLVGNGASYDYYGGHADAGARVQYTVNPQGILFPGVKTLQSYSIGTAPGADGGSYTGTVATLMGTNAATDIDNGSADGHFNMTWDQSSAAVGSEWTLKDSNGDLYPASVGAWTVQSGSIYKTTVTFDSHFLQSSRGVVGVLITNGISGSGGKYLGNLTAAASLGAMTAGTYFASGTTLYTWMPDGTQPNTSATNHVLVSSAALSTWFNVYFKEDGSDARILCPIYSLTNDGESIYLNEPFVNASPDGLVAFFNSDLGTYDGFVDLIAAELPTS